MTLNLGVISITNCRILFNGGTYKFFCHLSTISCSVCHNDVFNKVKYLTVKPNLESLPAKRQKQQAAPPNPETLD
jgi:hypothetical protein